MSRIAIICGLILTVAGAMIGCAYRQASLKTIESAYSDVQWGPINNGLQLGVSIGSHYAECFIKNSGTTRVRIVDHSYCKNRWCKYSSFNIVIREKGAKEWQS